MAQQKITLNKHKSVPALGGRISSVSFPFTSIFNTPIGKMGLITQNGILTRLHFLFESDCSTFTGDADSEMISQLQQYFQNPHTGFSVNYQLNGTPFQRKVWKSLLEIPVGQTLTYGQMARLLHSGPRAIGQACRTNPIPLIIPCHRIVAQNAIGGYSGTKQGTWIEAKQWLLQHESYLQQH